MNWAVEDTHMGPPWGVTTYEALTQYESSLKGYIKVVDFSESAGNVLGVTQPPQLHKCLLLRYHLPKLTKQWHPWSSVLSLPRGMVSLWPDKPWESHPQSSGRLGVFQKIHRACVEHNRDRCGSSPACRVIIWSLKGIVGTLGTYPGQDLRKMSEYTGLNSRHVSSTEMALQIPHHLNTSEHSQAVFIF